MATIIYLYIVATFPTVSTRLSCSWTSLVARVLQSAAFVAVICNGVGGYCRSDCVSLESRIGRSSDCSIRGSRSQRRSALPRNPVPPPVCSSPPINAVGGRTQARPSASDHPWDEGRYGARHSGSDRERFPPRLSGSRSRAHSGCIQLPSFARHKLDRA